MDYATADDMLARFGEAELIALTDKADNAQIKPERIERALGDAQAFVDGYLGQTYQLPLAGCAKPTGNPARPVERVAPPLLTRIVCDVARYYLYDDLAPEHEVARRYGQASGTLGDIALGKAALACPWGGEAGVRLASHAVRYHFSPRAMSDEALEGYA